MDNQYYEMPKWSTWEIETWVRENNPIFQMYRQFKWATLDLDEVKYLDRDKDFDESLFKLFPTCPKEIGFYSTGCCGAITEGWDIHNFPSCEDKEILKEYEELVKEQYWLDALENMGYRQEENEIFFQLKKEGDYKFDIAKDFKEFVDHKEGEEDE